jgi:YceI-like domain
VQTALGLVYQVDGALLVFKLGSIGVLGCLLLACGSPQTRHSPTARTLNLSVPQPNPSAQLYQIDPAQSELRVLVYRGGALARFGHNHVMVNRAIQGSVSVGTPLSASSFSLALPVMQFVVDDPQSRGEEGADFPGTVPEDAKSGTLRNMLSASLLDAVDYPLISIASRSISGSNTALVVTLAIRVAGHESTIDVPFTLARDRRQLSASGSLEMRQTSIGLTPYSLMLGALQVQDTVRIKFKIVAAAG